jgi:antitoxin (DNA-binding transcriptional repressor) of toxin-antitoxin stability system
MEYKKINLRKFRHNLTQLKDSLANGQAYEVVERGQPLAYFIPVDYKVTLEKKNSKKDVKKILDDAIGCVKMSENKKKTFDYEKEYRKAMEEKHLK